MHITQYLSSISSQIICSLCCILTICFLFVKLMAFITGWHIIGILIILYGAYKILRGVAMFALYPGCFNYIKSDNQLRGSQRMAQNIIKHSQSLFGLIHRCQQHPQNGLLVGLNFSDHVNQMIRMLQKFQDSLSERKKTLLRIYRYIDQTLKMEYKSDSISISLELFLQNPEKFRSQIIQKKGNSDQIRNVAVFLKDKMAPYMKQIHQILVSFNPPAQGIVQMFLYKLYGQKLYEIRFAYVYWDSKFQYSFHLIQAKQTNVVLECAVIKGKKNSMISANTAALICCPNGAFLQYFALQSQYINMYLEMGHQIILWNYRGYGQSTGSPSISASISDAQVIYNYCKANLRLDPVISHGYSIGGPPAVCLASSQPFKTLVVDRSFCNFVNIAHEISPVLAKLAKLVMITDSKINISDVYLKIRNTRKILIWSAIDQIISNGSSLKLGVLKRLELKSQGNQKSKPGKNSDQNLITQDEIYQKQSFIQNSNTNNNQKNDYKIGTLKKWFQNTLDFFRIVSMLHQAEKNYQQTFSVSHNQQGKGFNNSLMEEVAQELSNKNESESIWKNQQHRQFLNKVWAILNNIDGGGTTIKFLRQLAQGGTQKQQQLNLQVKSFVLGLVFFGSCLHQNQIVNNLTLNNWPHTITSLKKSDEQLSSLLDEYKSKGPQQLIKYIIQLHVCLKQIRQYIQKSDKSIDNLLGIVIPTDSGHNGDLTNSQMQYLKRAIINDKSDNSQQQGMMISQ